MPSSVWLFSYGTLQLRQVQIASFGRELAGHADALVGWTRTMIAILDPEVVKTSGEANHPIVSETGNPSDEVPGRVFEITPAELEAADAYEVSDYKRVLVTLKSGTGAWVYVKA